MRPVLQLLLFSTLLFGFDNLSVEVSEERPLGEFLENCVCEIFHPNGRTSYLSMNTYEVMFNFSKLCLTSFEINSKKLDQICKVSSDF